MGKSSRRPETPKNVPCFFLLTKEQPWLSLVTQQRGEARRSCPDAQGLQTLFPASSFSHERITLVESGHAAGRGGVKKLSRRPGTPNFVSILLQSQERITLVWSGHAARRRGVGKFSRPQGLQTLFPDSSFSRENNPG